MYGCITGRILLWQMILALLEMKAKCLMFLCQRRFAPQFIPCKHNISSDIFRQGFFFFLAKGKVFFLGLISKVFYLSFVEIVILLVIKCMDQFPVLKLSCNPVMFVDVVLLKTIYRTFVQHMVLKF